MIRKAKEKDILSIEKIYLSIHEREQAGLAQIGWLPGIYPTMDTARMALDRNDLYVYEDENGMIVASAIINQIQVPEYKLGDWENEVDNDEIMVLHTLVVDPYISSKGIGTQMVSFYEKMAREQRCKALRMDTNAINEVARSFYKKKGYKEIGIVPCVFNNIPNVQLVLLEKSL